VCNVGMAVAQLLLVTKHVGFPEITSITASLLVVVNLFAAFDNVKSCIL